MKVFRIILIIFGIFLVLLFTVPLVLPTTSHVERSIEINKPIDEVYKVVLDLNNYGVWSPWTALEHDAVFTIVSNDPKKGSKIEWVGDTIGTGSLTRTEISRDSIIISDLVLAKPWDSRAIDIFKFEPTVNGVKVSWANQMKMEYPFGRYMGVIMDSFLGKDYTKGLKKLKDYCDSTIKTPMFAISEEKAMTTHLYFISDSTSLDSKSINRNLDKAYSELLAFYRKNKLDKPSAPIAITNDHTKDKWFFDAGFKSADTTLKLVGRIQKGVLAGNKVLKCVFVGSYQDGKLAYRQIHNYMKVKGYVADGRPWEEYVSDPADTPEENLITNIYYPVKSGKKKSK